ncbi:HEAT repeat domain-containing protein [Nocardiopsis sp. NPDC050513]|uniref:HEAT repeat domain-containing protein n=1 Tax=Nocardiopsis sp. NPDC050513 TaxID=3364338 RepID=UPI0037B2BD05
MSPAQPTHASATQLLQSLDHLAPDVRMRRLALYARDHAGTSHLSVVLRRLDADGHARIALHMAIAARDTATVARYLAGPDHALRRAALRAVRTVPVPDEAVLPVVEDAPTGLRRALYRTLYDGRRTALAERVLDRVGHEYGDADAAAVLPACPTAAVARRLPDLAHAVRSWRRLARRHPDALLGMLSDVAPREALTRDWRQALRALDPIRPEAVAELLRPLGPSFGVPHASRALHARGDHRYYPARYPALPDGSRSIRSLTRTMAYDPDTAGRVLRAMPLSVRRPYLERFVGTRPARTGGGAVLHLDLLPPERAEAEARELVERIREVQSSQPRHADPNADLDVIGFLPYDEAVGPLSRAASSGDAGRRARGLAALVAATARTCDTDLLRGVLADRVARLRADRDTVRRELLRALCGVRPLSLARAAGLVDAGTPADTGSGQGGAVRGEPRHGGAGAPGTGVLDGLLDQTVTARDTSRDTRRALRDLAARMLRHPDTSPDGAVRRWGVEVYAQLAEAFGADGFGEPGRPRRGRPWWSRPNRTRPPGTRPEPHLDQVLPPGCEHDLYRRLVPYLDAARGRGDNAVAARLADELGGRAGHLGDGFRHRLVGVFLGDPASDDAERTARLYLSGRGSRAFELFCRDSEAVAVPVVWRTLVRTVSPMRIVRRLDHVGPPQLPDGRAWVPEVTGTLARNWPEAARAWIADRLAHVAADPGYTPDDREAAISQLGRLPGAVDLLARFLAGDDIVVREAALSALGGGGEPERALQTILAHSGGPQSRAVGPALSRCAVRVAPSRLGPVLIATLEGSARVSVRRTAARLLEHHRPPGAVDVLVRSLGAERQHRDVRAAVAGALMRACGHPSALTALTEHAPGFTDEETQAAVLGVDPLTCPRGLRAGAAAVVASLPASGRRRPRSLRAANRWALWREDALDAIVAAVCDLDRPWQHTVGAFAEMTRRGQGRDRLAEVAARLLAAVPGPEHGVPAITRPRADGAYHRLAAIVSLLVRLRHTSGEDDTLVAGQVDAVLSALAERPECAHLAARLVESAIRSAVRRPDGAPSASWLASRLSLAARFLAAAPRRRDPDVRSLVTTVVGHGADPDVAPESLETVLRTMHATAVGEEGRARTSIGLLYVELVGRMGRTTAWAEPWPELLTLAGEIGDDAVRHEAWRVAVE